MHKIFHPGLDTLLADHRDWLLHRRVALLTHAAAVDQNRIPSWERIWKEPHIDLVALLSPEHGLKSQAAAGAKVHSRQHPPTGIPVHSLYADTRKPTREMLTGIDVVVCDLQDLAYRCYTYVSTLMNVLEAAAENDKPVIVCDRPVPLPRTVDGPMLNPAFRNFVAQAPVPLVYGMTPAETAVYLTSHGGIKVDLQVARMQHYTRDTAWPADMPWIPPSPGIRTWQTAMTYPALVCFEALPGCEYGRGGNRVFRGISASWLDVDALCDALNRQSLKGVYFRSTHDGDKSFMQLDITAPAAYQPVQSSITILSTIQRMYGADCLWTKEVTREDFFDNLMGTDQVRQDLQQGKAPDEICAAWLQPQQAFYTGRRDCLLYPE